MFSLEFFNLDNNKEIETKFPYKLTIYFIIFLILILFLIFIIIFMIIKYNNENNNLQKNINTIYDTIIEINGKIEKINNQTNQNNEIKGKNVKLNNIIVSTDKPNLQNKELRNNINEINNKEEQFYLKSGNEELKKNLNGAESIFEKNITDSKLQNNEFKKNLDLDISENEFKGETCEQKNNINITQNEINNNERDIIKNKINITENELRQRIFELEIEKDKLKNETKEIKLENVELKRKINELENEINELKKNVNKINNEKANLEHRIDIIEKEKEERNTYYNSLFQKSTIIKKEERDLISKWILPYYNLNFELLYLGSRDGFTNEAFHQRCDNKGPTLFVVKLENNKRIGGFASQSWHNKGGEPIKDNNTFLFSLDNKIKYGLKEKNSGYLYGQDSSSVLFGVNGLQLGDDFLIYGQNVVCRSEGLKFNFVQSDLCGAHVVKDIEYEVYAVKNYI